MAWSRYIIAFVAGSVAYVLILFRFLSYSERNKLPGDAYLTFAGAALAIGFVVSLGASKGRYRATGFVLLGVCFAHWLVIIADYQHDPTTHNLLPLEFVILCVVAAPAYAGAGLAHVVDYVRRGSARA